VKYDYVPDEQGYAFEKGCQAEINERAKAPRRSVPDGVEQVAVEASSVARRTMRGSPYLCSLSRSGVLSLLSTTTIFGTPVDITPSELALESFFPADAATLEILRRMVLPTD
jgi:hypothetical protein